MTYAFDMIGYFGKLEPDKVSLNTRKTFSVLAYRHSAPKRDGVDPIKTSDESLRYPLESLDVPFEIKQKAEEIVQTQLFTPEYLQNLRKLKLENGVLHFDTNLVNYGSLPTTRALMQYFPEEQMLPVINQIAPMGSIAILVNESDQFFSYARRAAKVAVSGRWHGIPGGTYSEGDDIFSNIMREAKEELSKSGREEDSEFEFGGDNQAYLVGLNRGRYHSLAVGLDFIIYTNWSLNRMWQNLADEHDLIRAIPLDEKALRVEILDMLFGGTPEGKTYDKLVDHGLGAMLHMGRLHFGNGWYDQMAKELTDPKVGVRIYENNPFA